MAVIFGKAPDAEGWIRVTVIQYMMESHEDGYPADAGNIPDYPESGKGVGWCQFYHPGKNEWKFDPVKIPYTKEESLLEIAAAIRDLAQAIKEK